MEMGRKKVTSDKTLLGASAIRPPERKGWDRVRRFFYDPDTGKILTRTPKSWGLILLFYLLFYSCLFSFWYILFKIAFVFVPKNRPTYILDSGLIGSNPGVGMSPKHPDKSIKSTIMFLNPYAKQESPSEDYQSCKNIDWAERYRISLENYNNTVDAVRTCEEGNTLNENSTACKFDPYEILGDCAEFPYGYLLEEGQKQIEPCILLMINRIYGWKPKEYSDEDLNDEQIPENVQKLIRKDLKNKKKNVYIDCQGSNPADKEALNENLSYFPPTQSIPFKYFPYTQTLGSYHKPIVAVKFSNLPIGQLVHVECKLWTKGIEHSSKNKLGQVQFNILLENYCKV